MKTKKLIHKNSFEGGQMMDKVILPKTSRTL